MEKATVHPAANPFFRILKNVPSALLFRRLCHLTHRSRRIGLIRAWYRIHLIIISSGRSQTCIYISRFVRGSNLAVGPVLTVWSEDDIPAGSRNFLPGYFQTIRSGRCHFQFCQRTQYYPHRRFVGKRSIVQILHRTHLIIIGNACLQPFMREAVAALRP